MIFVTLRFRQIFDKAALIDTVSAKPEFPFFHPGAKLFLGHGITKSKRDKIGAAILPPVRQVISIPSDLFVGVERLQCHERE
jgi:hypothetical protein